MAYRVILVLAIAAVFFVCGLVRERLEHPARPESVPFWQCDRIVAMTPGVVEVLDNLGLNDRIVGVAAECRGMPSVLGKPEIGASDTPNYESLVAVRPDLVILGQKQSGPFANLKKLKFETLFVPDRTVEDVVESYRTIGRVCGKGADGRRIAQSLEARLANVRGKVEGRPRPSVLVTCEQAKDIGLPRSRGVVGDDPFVNNVIELAGGQKAYLPEGRCRSVVSPAWIVRVNPEVIVDFVAPETLATSDREEVPARWRPFDQVAAVQNRRVLMVGQDTENVHGLRSIDLVEALAKKMHPEVEWDEATADVPP
jgi:iron complex transport system substrate-binding protein